MKSETIRKFDNLVKEGKAVYIEEIKNPVRFNGDNSVTIFCNGNDNIYECLIDKDDLKKFPKRYLTATIRKKYLYDIRFRFGDMVIYYIILNRENSTDGLVVDHINRDTKDNRKENLRVVKQGINMINKNVYSNAALQEKNIHQLKNGYYQVLANRKYKNKSYALEVRDKIVAILDEYTYKDMKYR